MTGWTPPRLTQPAYGPPRSAMSPSYSGPLSRPNSSRQFLIENDTAGQQREQARVDLWNNFGVFMASFGTGAAMVGSFFEVKAMQSRLKSAELSHQFEQSMSAIDARASEREAQSVLEGAQADIGALTMRAGAEKSARRATMAGRGIRLGVGNAAEVQASGDIIKEIDVRTVSINAARSAAAARRGGVNSRNRALMAGVSASNARRSANSMSPYAAAGESLLTSTTRIGSQWATDRRYGGR